MQYSIIARHIILAGLIVVFSGCSEGMLWRTGYLSPWARKKWAEEDQIAETLFSKRRRIRELVEQTNAGQADPNRTAEILSQIALKDQVVLLRIEAVTLLGEVNSPLALKGLQTAIKDPSPDVRLAAVKSWSNKKSTPQTVLALQSVVGSDSNLDVRIAATRALGQFEGPQAVEALSLAIKDRDPAIKLTATESLGQVTGMEFGGDVSKWNEYLANRSPSTQDRNNLPGQYGPGKQFGNTFPERNVMFESNETSDR